MSRSLSLQGIGRVWSNGVIALEGITFEAREGTITAIIGPSGAGKSTLLRLIAGLDGPGKGSIDNPFGPPGFCFSEPSLWPHRTLLDNVKLPLRLARKLSDSDSDNKARAILQQWGLGDRLHAYPAELSLGQQQRGALARTAVLEPKLICLDEVTSSLDPELSAVVVKSILQWRRRGAVILVATHLGEMLWSADQILFLESGRVIQQGAAAELLLTHNERTRAFLGTFPGSFTKANHEASSPL